MQENFARQAIIQFNPDSAALTGNPKLKEKMQKKLGEETYMINSIIEIPEEETSENFDHLQKIEIFVNNKMQFFSGAFFKKYEPKEEPLHMKVFKEMCCSSKE